MGRKVALIYVTHAIHVFFYKQHFYKQCQVEIGKKNQAKIKQHREAELLLLKIIRFLQTHYHSQIIGDVLKIYKKQMHLFEWFIWLTTTKRRLKMKNRSHRYDMNRPRPRHGHTCTKYEMCLSILMVICIKQHLSNIWSSIHEKVKQHWGWVEKKACISRKYRS